eukprot:GHVT01021039.1.p1 GENE.GHVT01021039.1~~GHVT01021039.1.p1  ORF type:complete len:386 (-),score=73.21 GHVT01021039.1:388-1545(-)
MDALRLVESRPSRRTLQPAHAPNPTARLAADGWLWCFNAPAMGRGLRYFGAAAVAERKRRYKRRTGAASSVILLLMLAFTLSGTPHPSPRSSPPSPSAPLGPHCAANRDSEDADVAVSAFVDLPSFHYADKAISSFRRMCGWPSCFGHVPGLHFDSLPGRPADSWLAYFTGGLKIPSGTVRTPFSGSLIFAAADGGGRGQEAWQGEALKTLQLQRTALEEQTRMEISIITLEKHNAKLAKDNDMWKKKIAASSAALIGGSIMLSVLLVYQLRSSKNEKKDLENKRLKQKLLEMNIVRQFPDAVIVSPSQIADTRRKNLRAGGDNPRPSVEARFLTRARTQRKEKEGPRTEQKPEHNKKPKAAKKEKYVPQKLTPKLGPKLANGDK